MAAMACAADPGLDAEPSAGYEGAEHCGEIGSAGAEAGAHEDGKWDSVLRAGVGVEQHGDEDDEVAEQDGEDGLLPVHAACDERRGEHVGGDLHGHGEPEGDVVVGGPGALCWCGGGEVGVVEAWVVWRVLIDLMSGLRRRAVASFPGSSCVLRDVDVIAASGCRDAICRCRR